MPIRRLASPEELRDANRVNTLAWRDAYRGLVPGDVLDGLSLDGSVGTVEERFAELTGESGAFFVAVVDDEVRGYARVRWGETKPFVDPDEAGLKEIYVHPDHWGDGVGTRLLDRVLDSLPDRIDALVLEMLAGNERAYAFYTHRGFEHTGSRTAEFAGEPLETAIYRREL